MSHDNSLDFAAVYYYSARRVQRKEHDFLCQQVTDLHDFYVAWTIPRQLKMKIKI
jgi:hypothetical protein